MNIIYISQACSDNTFCKYVNNGCIDSIPNAQKYHRLMMEGLAKENNVFSLSGLPVKTEIKHPYYGSINEIENGVHYHNVSFVNIFIIRQFLLYKKAISYIKKLYREKKDLIIVCDIWYLAMSSAARKIGKKLGIPVVGIVTDVPAHTLNTRRKNMSHLKRMIAEKIELKTSKTVNSYDGYLFLTAPMNDVINNSRKPYIILEGHANVKDIVSESSYKAVPRVIMYAGGIHKEYGIERLVNAFIFGDYKGWELHIYGKGNFEKDLDVICKKYSNIKYFGVIQNKEIIEKQRHASLLINPRITDGEYVKYSFPSKTFEYMASGTPLLMTRLPWMPNEYEDYVFLFSSETQDGFRETLDYVLSLEPDKLNQKGLEARNFILKEKNNIIQAKRFSEFLENNYV